MKELLSKEYLNNTLAKYMWALGLLLVGFFLVTILKFVIQKKMKQRMEKEEQIYDNSIPDRVMKYLPPLMYIGILYLSLHLLIIPASVQRILDIGLLALGMIYFALLLTTMIEYSIQKYEMKFQSDANKQSAIHWINKLAKAIIWAITLILFIQNMGIDISALVAGLGIGGIAVAFAAQAILEDVFSYFTIFFDRPFEIGDFIITGEHKGTVEYIGVRTTRLRSLGGEQLVFPNKDLTKARIQNYKEMEQRRVLFSIGVTYDTPLNKLKAIPEAIQKIVEEVPDTRFDRAHFYSYGGSSLNFEIVYYVLNSDYNIYMDIQQQINFSIKENFDRLGIEFAYPTQTVYLQGSEHMGQHQPF